MTAKILMIEDDTALQTAFSQYLEGVDYRVKTAGSLAEGKILFSLESFDVVLLDLNLPDGNGLDLIPDMRQSHGGLSIVVITGSGAVGHAVEAMRRGADHFLTKPVDLTELDMLMRKSLELNALRRTTIAHERLQASREPIFGGSAAMRQAVHLASIAAERDAPIIILGETGSGKSMLARWIHRHSGRREGQFVELNCSGLHGEMLNSELFGHARGAFTSAVRDRPGLFEVADGGTMFLDEIGDMDIAVQAQLLKVLEEKQYRRMGEVKVRKSDFRLICATHRDLLQAAQSGAFRQDLYYRIQVFPIQLPPLRDRVEDLPDLAGRILSEEFAYREGIDADVRALLGRYDWPGNVRELRNVLERAVMLARGGKLTAYHFPGLPNSADEPADDATENPLRKAERECIQRTLRQCGNDVARAVEILQISRATLYRKLKIKP
jgi:DNA-binding NtrC family response regulator